MIIEFSKEIKEAIVMLLNNSIIVSSWGISDFFVEEDFISFYVDGLKYKGVININVSNSRSNFNIQIGERNIIGCELSMLVETIDKEVEYTVNYEKDLVETLKIQI